MSFNTLIPETSPVPSPQERRDRNKVLLLAALEAAGATCATVRYNGCGDEGRAEEVSAFSADKTPIDLSRAIAVFAEDNKFADDQWHCTIVQEERPLEDVLADFAMEAVSDHHGRWEDNEGGGGKVVFDCEAGTVRIEHNEFYTESEYTETTL